jgi:hypothetical protein
MMKTEKPLKLIELLKQLLAETEKMNIGRIYISITEEARKITFSEANTNQFSELVYKHLIELSIKDFIHAGRSDASRKVVQDVIDVISEAQIIAA